MALTIAVVQQKGGSGKTTLTINLAAAACLERELKGGHRTLILDIDPQASAADWRLTVPPESPLQELEVKTWPKALNVPTFDSLTADFDYVFIDCPGRGDALANTAAALADVVLVPLQPGALDFYATERTLAGVDLADDLGKGFRRRAPLRLIVLNRVPQGTQLAKEAEEGLKTAGLKVVGTVYQRVAFGMATLRGESVFTFNASAKLAAADIAKLWRAVKKEVHGHSPKKSRRGK